MRVSGSCRYVADLALPGMLHAEVTTSRIASARLEGLDTGPATAVAGVEAVLTATDIPGSNAVGVIFADQPLLVEDRIRMVGDRLAVIAARTPEAARRAAAAVKAELTPLPGVHDPVAALAGR